MNHFKTALTDPDVINEFKNKPYHMAILYSLSQYIEQGYKLSDLSWFKLCVGRINI